MEHDQPTDEARLSARTPPYVSFRTTLTVLEDLKTVGVPPRIDRSVLSRFSGGVGSQILMALKALGLIEDDGTPTPALLRLVEAYGTPGFKGELQSVLNRAYPFLSSLDLTTATPSMFAEAFKNAVDAKEDVLRKCRTFYLHAAKEAGIEIGARLEKGSHPRSPSTNGTRKRKKTTRADDAAGAAPVTHAAPPPGQPLRKELEYELVDLMTDPEVDDEIKPAIWQLVQYLTARKAKKAAASKDATAS
ncbi:DUF5343 domain-containing protein [Propylenella binzhouense]|uniref:DUF5343 domain-containing protein n=1 Tax=Propylenella binzhouense TaxID=2555902 RepID=A0A964T9F9_9HYPH|nr:DUF5343 domain-containing protein [Propylenella binzhouense]MYZ50327.1 hypothetical protein [Propylenella binzhouense]